jgi:prepilin-type processing-associated H-X9-DG protein
MSHSSSDVIVLVHGRKFGFLFIDGHVFPVGLNLANCIKKSLSILRVEM